MRKNNRRGVALVLIAALMVGMFTFLAIVFDFSRMYAQKNELQTAADAASLAGVLELLSDTTLVSDSAISIGQRNEVLKQTIALFPADVDCGIWDDATAQYTPLHSGTTCASSDNAVRVATRDSANFVFPVLVGATGKELTTSAIAWAAYIGAATCVKPIGIPYSLLTKTLDPNNPDTLRVLNQYDLEQLRTLTRDQLRFKLKIASPDSAAYPGNTGALNLPMDQGADDYRTNLATCYRGYIGVDTVITLKPGSMPQPTFMGLGGWGQLAGFCDPLTPDPRSDSTKSTDGQCQDGAGNMGQLMVTPLWYPDNCTGGSCPVPVKGLVSFKLDTVTAQAEIIGHFVPGNWGGTVSATPSTVRRIVLVK